MAPRRDGRVPELHCELFILETAGNTVVTTVPVGGTPVRVAVNPAGTRVWLCLLGVGAWKLARARRR